MRLLLQNRSIQTFYLLVFFACIICWRSSDVLLYGRFWAEEGDNFFYHAWITPPLKMLLYSFGGYLNLATNATSLIAAHYIPLHYAPYFTSITGLLFQLLPLFLLLTAKDEWLSSSKARILATLLLLLVPESIETSLQSLHIQFQLTLASVILLVLHPVSSYQRVFRLCILALAGLSGIMNICLIPFFFIQYFLEKKQYRLEQLSVVLISCTIQYFAFYETVSNRFHNFFISDFFEIFFVRNLLFPFFGINTKTIKYANFLHDHIHQLSATYIPTIFVIIFIVTVVIVFYHQPKTKKAALFFICALSILFLSIIGSIGEREGFLTPFNNQRYLFIGQALLCLTLLYIHFTSINTIRKISAVLIYWLIIVGSFNFANITFMNVAPIHYISWKNQVHLWKQNPNYIFQIWPNGWKITLPVNHTASMEKK